MSQVLSAEKDTELVPATDPRAAVISIDPERLHGAACFSGTRVPVQTLWDYLKAGDSLETFLEDFEGVTREQAVALLALAQEYLMKGLPAR